MTNKSKIIISFVALLVAFAFGRWSAPEKIKEVTKTVEVEKKLTQEEKDKQQNTHKKTKTVVVKNKDGSETTTTETSEDTDINDKVNKVIADDKSKSTTQEKEITKSSSKTTLSAMYGLKFNFTQPTLPIYGGSISREVLGPISIGLWGLSNGEGGASVGLSF